MSPAEAVKLLDLPADATPEQLEARFNELRRKLEDKIAKAPTPGLQAKYRESLTQITTAFETLVLAADSSTLPVAAKPSAVSHRPSAPAGPALAGSPALEPHPPASQKSKTKDRKPGKEFAVVALIAVALLGAGGWFVMKTRAENAEKARLAALAAQAAADAQAEKERQAAAAKAEQERLAEAARVAAEQKKQAEEAERIRLEKLTGQLRADLAEARVAWEALEREERTAERRLAELKSDLRGMRDVSSGRLAEAQAVVNAHQEYYTWLSETLARHPARVARSRAEELLSARQPDEARVALQELAGGLRALEAGIPRQRQELLDLDGDLAIKTNPDATWMLSDAFGRQRTGKGPAEFTDVAVGRAELKFTKEGWPVRSEQVVIRRTQPVSLDATFVGANVRVNSVPASARVFTPDGREVGVTPVQFTDLAPGGYELILKLPGHYDERTNFKTPGAPGEIGPVKMRARVTKPLKPVWRLPARFTMETTSNSSTDGNRSTGTFAKDAWRYNNNSSSASVKEWAFFDPDANGNWTRAEAKLISSSHGTPGGRTVHYTRQADGKWFDGTTAIAIDPTWGNSWLDQGWPPEDTPVGGTWKIDAYTTGKLVAFDRTPAADWATLQFTTDRVTKDQAEVRQSKSVTIRVNLGEGYIATYDSSDHTATTVKAVLIGQIGTDIRINYSFRIKVP